MSETASVRNEFSHDCIREAMKGMEYTLSRYFNEHFIPILDKEMKVTITQAQAAKNDLMFGNLNNVFESSLGREPYGYKPSEEVIEKSKKTLDDAYEKSVEKFLGTPSYQQDLSCIAEGYRITFMQELGEERYKQLSDRLKSELGETSSGDLAADYVEHRLEQLAIDRLAKQGLPSSSLDYIFNRGLINSAVGMFYSASQRKEGNLEAAAKEMREKLYDASGFEKLGSKVVEYGADALTFGTGLSAKALLNLTCLEGGLYVMEKEAELMKDKDNQILYDEYISEIIYGDKTALSELQEESKHFNATESNIVKVMNENLQNRVTVFKSYTMPEPIDFMAIAKGDIQTPDFTLLPEQKKEDRLEGVPLVIAPGKEEEYLKEKELAEAEKKENNVSTSKEGCPLETYSGPRGSYVMSSTSQNNIERSPQTQIQGQQNYLQSKQLPFTPNKDSMNGWRGLTDMLGLTGMSDLGRNSGYILAMLPDMLVGMFTGKYKSLRFEDNIFPIASILMGMFVKNPVLKFLLIAMGGANLLNKAGHEALGQTLTDKQSRHYRKYDNQELNDRIKDVAIKGDTLLATIDGVPQLITIKSEKALDAYYKGNLPLNTLANAVLDKYDEQNKTIISNYERDMSEKEEQRRVVGIK